MSSHMPPVPPANRSNKGSASSRKSGKRNNPQGAEDRTVKQTEQRHNAAEEGETANIKQNTTNKGFFRGRRKVDCVFDNRAQESATAAAAISGKITGQDPCPTSTGIARDIWKRPNRQPALAQIDNRTNSLALAQDIRKRCRVTVPGRDPMCLIQCNQ